MRLVGGDNEECTLLLGQVADLEIVASQHVHQAALSRVKRDWLAEHAQNARARVVGGANRATRELLRNAIFGKASKEIIDLGVARAGLLVAHAVHQGYALKRECVLFNPVLQHAHRQGNEVVGRGHVPEGVRRRVFHLAEERLAEAVQIKESRILIPKVVLVPCDGERVVAVGALRGLPEVEHVYRVPHLLEKPLHRFIDLALHVVDDEVSSRENLGHYHGENVAARLPAPRGREHD